MWAVELLFWSAIGLILYIYLGFPLLLALRALLFPRRVNKNPQVPTVSLVIAAYNEADVIIQKLDNVFSLRYPRTHLEVIVASDGSNDGTEDVVTHYSGGDVKLLVLPRQGKNRTLNAGVSASRGEILLFTDADTMMEKDCLLYLVESFSDPQVGAVGGDYRYKDDHQKKRGETTYWSYDRLWKRLESRSGSMTSAAGAIFAIRRSLFTPIPEKMGDDFYTSVQAPAAHRRLVFEPRAVAHGPMAESTDAEFERKVRVISGGLRGVWRMRSLLNPFQYGFYSIQLFSHRVLRRLAFVPLLMTAITAPVLWSYGAIFQTATLLQFAFHSGAIVAYLLRNTFIGRVKLFMLPLYFDMVNAASLVAILSLISSTRNDSWKPQRGRISTTQTPSVNYLVDYWRWFS